MRALAVLMLAGCLETPTGKRQDWPIEGTTVVTAIAANVDDDEGDEIVVAATGSSPGLYLFDDVDLVFAPDVNMLPRFKTYYPRDIPAQTALLHFAERILVAAPVTGGVEIEAVDAATLTRIVDDFTNPNTISSMSPQTPIWLHAAPFGPNGSNPRICVRADDRIYHFEPNTLESMNMMNEIPRDESISEGWLKSQVATSVEIAGPQVVVVLDTAIRRAPLPPGGMFDPWVDARGNTNRWLGQVAAVIGGDHEVVVGFDTVTEQICAVDPIAEPAATPTCLPDLFDNVSAATLLIDAILPGDDGLDLMAVLATDEGLKAELWAGITFTSGNLAGTRQMQGARFDPPPLRPTFVLAKHATQRDLIVIDESGTASCEPNAPICQ